MHKRNINLSECNYVLSLCSTRVANEIGRDTLEEVLEALEGTEFLSGDMIAQFTIRNSPVTLKVKTVQVTWTKDDGIVHINSLEEKYYAPTAEMAVQVIRKVAADERKK